VQPKHAANGCRWAAAGQQSSSQLIGSQVWPALPPSLLMRGAANDAAAQFSLTAEADAAGPPLTLEEAKAITGRFEVSVQRRLVEWMESSANARSEPLSSTMAAQPGASATTITTSTIATTIASTLSTTLTTDTITPPCSTTTTSAITSSEHNEAA